MNAFQIISLILLALGVANLARALWSAGYLTALAGSAQAIRTRPAPRPLARPVPPAVKPAVPRPAPVASKESTHELPPVAAPVKPAFKPSPVKPAAKATTDDDAAAESLFAGLEAKPAASVDPAQEATRKASRLAELGFHHSIDTQAAKPLPEEAKPRTQTAELDDILKRIDKVLADSVPSSTAPTAPAPVSPAPVPPAPAAAAPAPVAAPAAVPENPAAPVAPAAKMPESRPVTEDPAPGQQKLF